MDTETIPLFLSCFLLLSLSIKLEVLLSVLLGPAAVSGRALTASSLSFQGGDAVPDVVLYAFPRPCLQRFGLRQETLDAVVFLRDLLLLDQVRQVFLYSHNFSFLPLLPTLMLGICRGKEGKSELKNSEFRLKG